MSQSPAGSGDAGSPHDRHRLPRLMLVAAIVVVAAALRAWNLGGGLPDGIGIDEPQIMERVVRMMKSGDFNPHFFDWPSLTIYFQLAVACVTFLLGAMDGAWSHLDHVSAANFYANGRLLTAALGTATVVLVYLAGSRWGRGTAILAAALLAVVPYHVRESHFVLADVPAAFFVTLALLLTLRAGERPTLGAFALAGLATGLAASAKYNGVIAILLPMLVAWASSGTLVARLQRSLVIVGAVLAAFLAGTPYALLDMPGFLNDYARLAAIFANERGGEPGWSIYLKHLALALGRPAFVAAAAGLGIAVWKSLRGPDRARWALLVIFPVIYFQVMANSYQIYGRYLMPLLPFASLLAAVGVTTILAGLKRLPVPVWAVRTAATIVVLVVIVPPARTAIDFSRNFGRPAAEARVRQVRWVL